MQQFVQFVLKINFNCSSNLDVAKESDKEALKSKLQDQLVDEWSDADSF